MKSFCVSENIIKRVKRQPAEWDKLLENHIFLRDSYPEAGKVNYTSLEPVN